MDALCPFAKPRPLQYLLQMLRGDRADLRLVPDGTRCLLCYARSFRTYEGPDISTILLAWIGSCRPRLAAFPRTLFFECKGISAWSGSDAVIFHPFAFRIQKQALTRPTLRPLLLFLFQDLVAERALESQALNFKGSYLFCPIFWRESVSVFGGHELSAGLSSRRLGLWEIGRWRRWVGWLR
jgi:hypothetical protein